MCIRDRCYSGQECIDRVKEGQHYDAILMDIMMPEMDGVTALKELRKIEDITVPVIAVTADAIAGSEEKYLEEGCTAVSYTHLDVYKRQNFFVIDKNNLEKDTTVTYLMSPKEATTQVTYNNLSSVQTVSYTHLLQQ